MKGYTKSVLSASFEGLETRQLMSGAPEVPESILHRPTNLVAGQDGSSVTLTWQDNSENETNFGIFKVKMDGNRCTGMEQIGSVDANTTSFKLDASSGKSGYTVRAMNYSGISSGANFVFVNVESNNSTPETHETPKTPTPKVAELKEDVLHRPTDLTLSKTGVNVTLNWKDNSDNETKFGIFQVKMVGKRAVGMTQIGTVDANTTEFTFTSAIGCNVFTVRAINDAGQSSGSNFVTTKVEAFVQVTAPNKLRSEAKSSTSINLKWEGDRGAKGGYYIERSLDGQTGWTKVGTAAPNKRCYTDTGLTAGTYYYYRITAIGEDGSTATSNVLTGKTKINDKGEPSKNTTTTHK